MKHIRRLTVLTATVFLLISSGAQAADKKTDDTTALMDTYTKAAIAYVILSKCGLADHDLGKKIKNKAQKEGNALFNAHNFSSEEKNDISTALSMISDEKTFQSLKIEGENDPICAIYKEQGQKNIAAWLN